MSNSSIFAVCFVAVALHLIGIPALIWSLRTRQGLESDQEAYRSIQGGLPDAPAHRRQGPVKTALHHSYTRVQMGIFFGIIITMLLMMCAAQVYLAIIASHVPATIPVYH